MTTPSQTLKQIIESLSAGDIINLGTKNMPLTNQNQEMMRMRLDINTLHYLSMYRYYEGQMYHIEVKKVR